MNAQDKDTVVKILTTCKKMYPESKADAETFSIYIHLLDGYTPIEIKAAMLKCMRTSKWFPKPAEIIEAIDSVKATASGNKKPDASEAWQEAMENVRKYGCYKTWTYSCKEVEMACKRFGINELINLESDDVNVARAQFFKIYNSILSRNKEDDDNKQVLLSMGKSADMIVGGLVKMLGGAV